ncbi:hypothetical protein Kpol_1013p4 [Vanderwaltozyma polyspora DSM 70294]|uniref:Serine/threonine-protein phosphatase 2A activator n=1 Tax=Vanderwaltozyma polyspora (strain ATCC 22028 / DSM 70294 / BCRC 21397 / CBS 2163 / NBRC 10782 / NRRL Y-8283 / UCD 57-17) TaxID=436907 RepID=A7TH52_VANPO|nr:uncharacterized protein Kpol_1013p4 [Vanderwaltozyma polyspora DSM 70294]EDO18333.1 hypothetical protein Kpol_1013p4 [Vanderwaltozyma polyspora DSM 70294]
MIPEKRLLTPEDLELWDKSQTKHDLLEFIEKLAKSVEGHENKQYQEPITPQIESFMGLLKSVNNIIDKHPVVQDAKSSRFGKIEFRDFYDELTSQSKTLISNAYPSLTEDQLDQLYVYLDESWGNKQRIDYGSGHELNFLCLLYGLHKYKIFDESKDFTNMVLKIFIEYLRVMRILETKYWLEPAGSHGVWGLDDYHFLPFLFGAFQLATHKHLKPLSIHNEELVEMFQDKYLYFSCVAFINSVKTSTSLRFHSPMLDDISGVKKWSKVAEGMIKMYRAEVLSKLPIMQHFYFGEFLQCPEGVLGSKGHKHTGVVGEDECCESGHVHSSWGDCCGIKIPSAFAASESDKKVHKPLPFD